MAARIYRRSYKNYGLSSILCLIGSIFSGFIFLLKDLDKLFKLPVLFSYLIFAPNATFLVQFTAKYIKKNLQYIFKTVLEVQISISTHIIFLESL